MMCRLRTNLILNGKLVPFDTVLDDHEIPEHQRTPSIIAYDLECRDDGKVLALRDLSFQSVPSKGADGIPTRYPVPCGVRGNA
jgi:hypothetical protein